MRLNCDHCILLLPNVAVSQGIHRPDDALLWRELNALGALVVQVDCAPRGLVDAEFLQLSIMGMMCTVQGDPSDLFLSFVDINLTVRDHQCHTVQRWTKRWALGCEKLLLMLS